MRLMWVCVSYRYVVMLLAGVHVFVRVVRRVVSMIRCVCHVMLHVAACVV